VLDQNDEIVEAFQYEPHILTQELETPKGRLRVAELFSRMAACGTGGRLVKVARDLIDILHRAVCDDIFVIQPPE